MQKSRILIYQDYIHNHGQLYRALTPFGDIGFCDAQDILDGILNSNIDLFVMPGGADLYYCEKLNGDGNKFIRRYVEQGGAYLGICAGAYYACSAIEWAKGTTQEICGARELGFAEGTAIGPVYEFLENGDLDKSWHRDVSIHFQDENYSFDSLVSYRAGPILPETGTVLARYDQGPAIIECQIGKGLAILSSPHIEQIMPYAERSLYKHRNKSFEHEKEVSSTLASQTESQSKLWKIILTRLMPHSSEEKKNAA